MVHNLHQVPYAWWCTTCIQGYISSCSSRKHRDNQLLCFVLPSFLKKAKSRDGGGVTLKLWQARRPDGRRRWVSSVRRSAQDGVLNKFEMMWQIRILFPPGKACVFFFSPDSWGQCQDFSREGQRSEVNLDPDTLTDMTSDRLFVSVVVFPVLRTRTHWHGWTSLRRSWGLSEEEWVACDRAPYW